MSEDMFDFEDVLMDIPLSRINLVARCLKVCLLPLRLK
jgi:hypothetical protein